MLAVQAALENADARTAGGAAPHLVVLDEGVHTAAAAAAALRVEGGQIANSLILDADGEPLPVLTSGPEIWVGGVPQVVFPITYAELVRVTGGTATEVA